MKSRYEKVQYSLNLNIWAAACSIHA